MIILDENLLLFFFSLFLFFFYLVKLDFDYTLEAIFRVRTSYVSSKNK